MMHSSSSNRTKRTQILTALSLLFTFYCLYNLYQIFPSSNTHPTTTVIRDTTPSTTETTVGSSSFPMKEMTPSPLSQPSVCKTDRVLRNVDPNHTNAHLSFWQHLTDGTVQIYKRRWQKFVSSVKRTEIPSTQWEGKGIVLVAGNRDTFQRTLTAIKMLRHEHHCELDIEVWHLSDEQPSAEMKRELESLGAVPKDLSDPQLIRPIISRSAAEKQFQIKAAAVINSSFKEILYLDSDNVPAQDPTFLFETEEYKNTGALFWPDFWKTHGDNKIFDVLDIPCEDEWEQESGQMVIDKEKSWLPLQLAWYLQKHYEIYFQFLNGDKDTFKYAWKALDIPYTMAEAFVGMAGTMAGDRFCGHTMLQYFPKEDENDQLLFVHANLLKITDKRHFMRKDEKGKEEEHPWGLAKRSTLSHGNTYIKPEFYVTPDGRACMDFTHREGEPEAVTEDFDAVVPYFQANYFKYGGIGGETR